jgi:hypothetical protein
MSEGDPVAETAEHTNAALLAAAAPPPLHAYDRELAATLEAFLAANPNGTPSMANLAAFADARNNGVDLAAPAHVASETQSG